MHASVTLDPCDYRLVRAERGRGRERELKSKQEKERASKRHAHTPFEDIEDIVDVTRTMTVVDSVTHT